MKGLKYLVSAIFLAQGIAFANINDIYIADIEYDWINKSMVEKEAIISEVHDIMFQDDMSKQPNIKPAFKNRMKDKEHLEHYMAASAGYDEYKDYKIAAFYYKKQKNIYMYALQDKNDLTHNYYYDAMGHLRYIDFIYGEYPDYPYYSYQYRVSGKPVSAIYFVSKDTQYLFNPDGEFTGVWYKYSLYDKHSKVILTRTAY